ncbi:MAG: glycosyltransferase [Janthinobacterium lividum]
MRILQVMAGAERGGAEKFFDRLIPALAKRHLQQHVVCRPFPSRVNPFELQNIAVTTAPFRRLLDFRTPKIIRGAVDQFQPDIVMTWMSRASDLCPSGDFVSVARLGGYYDLKYYQKANYLIGNTVDIQQYFIKERWPSEKTAYLPNFVDPPADVASQNRAVYNTPENAFLILSMGRFHDDKAFDILIPALVSLSDVYLWLVGEGEREVSLRTLAQRHGVQDRVRFIPWQYNVGTLYRAANAYICPSRIEPLGNVIIEAWAYGLPVIAAKSAGALGLIQEGENGLLVPLEDIEGMAQAIQRVQQEANLASDLAKAGEETYLDHFTEEKVCRQYIDFFHKILQTKPKV